MSDLYMFYGIPDDDYDSHDPVACGRDAQDSKLNTIMPEDSKLPDKQGYAKLIELHARKVLKTFETLVSNLKRLCLYLVRLGLDILKIQVCVITAS